MKDSTVKLDRVQNTVGYRSPFYNIREWFVLGEDDKGKSFINVVEAKYRGEAEDQGKRWARREGLTFKFTNVL